ncbi:hypothetical protein J6590_069146 [Homalodisca vitripennis]|nr:hypothetical protein J6590_069146 [Homalodisca vitripennis]
MNTCFVFVCSVFFICCSINMLLQYEDDDEEILPAEEAVEEPCLNDNNLLDGVEQLKLDLSQPPPEQSLGSDFELFKDLQINTSDQLIPGLDLSPTPTDDLIGMH